MTTGSDSADLPAKHDRPIVWTQDGSPMNTNVKPTRATVQLYAPQAQPLIPLEAGTLTTVPNFDCSNGYAECDATADLKYTGPQPVDLDHVDVLLATDNAFKHIVAAGQLTASAAPILNSGTTIPLSGSVVIPHAIQDGTPSTGTDYVVFYDHP